MLPLWVERLKGSLPVEQPIAGDELRAIKRYLATCNRQAAMAVPGPAHPPGRELYGPVRQREGEARPRLVAHAATLLRILFGRRGYDLPTMQDYLGHRDPKHTAHYTRFAGVSVRRFVAVKQEGPRSRWPPRQRISALVVIAVDLLKEGLSVECVGRADDAGNDRMRKEGGQDGLHGITP
jgi:hypothetical protein